MPRLMHMAHLYKPESIYHDDYAQLHCVSMVGSEDEDLNIYLTPLYNSLSMEDQHHLYKNHLPNDN